MQCNIVEAMQIQSDPTEYYINGTYYIIQNQIIFTVEDTKFGTKITQSISSYYTKIVSNPNRPIFRIGTMWKLKSYKSFNSAIFQNNKMKPSSHFILKHPNSAMVLLFHSNPSHSILLHIISFYTTDSTIITCS